MIYNDLLDLINKSILLSEKEQRMNIHLKDMKPVFPPREKYIFPLNTINFNACKRYHDKLR